MLQTKRTTIALTLLSPIVIHFTSLVESMGGYFQSRLLFLVGDSYHKTKSAGIPPKVKTKNPIFFLYKNFFYLLSIIYYRMLLLTFASICRKLTKTNISEGFNLEG